MCAGISIKSLGLDLVMLYNVTGFGNPPHCFAEKQPHNDFLQTV